MLDLLVEFRHFSTKLDQVRRNCHSTKWFFRRNGFRRSGSFDEMAVDEMVLDEVSRILYNHKEKNHNLLIYIIKSACQTKCNYLLSLTRIASDLRISRMPKIFHAKLNLVLPFFIQSQFCLSNIL